MSHPHRLLTLLSLGLVFAAGLDACKSHRTNATDAGRRRTAPPHERRGPPMGTRRASPMVTGTIRWHEGPVPGATVFAVDQPDERVTTGADGRYALSLPVGSTQLIRVSRGSNKTVQSMVVVGVEGFDFELVATDEVAQALSAIGLTEDAARGMLVLRFLGANGARMSGCGASLSVPGGTRFVLTHGEQARSRTAGANNPERITAIRQDTTGTDNPELIIANVPAGVVTITPASPSGITCTPTYGAASVRVDPQTITDVTFECRSRAR